VKRQIEGDFALAHAARGGVQEGLAEFEIFEVVAVVHVCLSVAIASIIS